MVPFIGFTAGIGDAFIEARGEKVFLVKIDSIDKEGKQSESNKEITDLLRCITNNRSEIYLNGCRTAADSKWIGAADNSIARMISKILKEVRIRGNVGLTLGLGYFTIGDSVTYLGGEKQ